MIGIFRSNAARRLANDSDSPGTREAERRLAADMLAELETESAHRSAALAGAFYRAEAAERAAVKALEAARIAAGQASSTWANYSRSIDSAKQLLEQRIRDAAEPELVALLGWLRTEFDHLRGATVHPVGEYRTRHLAALLDARRAAEALQLEALSRDEVLERVAAIRAEAAQ